MENNIHKKNSIRRLVILVILIIGVITITQNIFMRRSIEPQSSSESIVGHVLAITPRPTNTNKQHSLNQIVEKALQGTKGIYGIAIINLRTGENYFANEHRSFKTGSLYKLWVMTTVYNQIETGGLRKKDILSREANVLNAKFNIASESAEIKDRKITYSVDEALLKMITLSDNYSAHLLTDKISLASLANFLYVKDFDESKVGITGGDPVTSAHDMALFFAKLIKNQLADEDSTKEMLSLLKWQKLNSKIPKYLPDNTIIAHKTGEFDEFTHDAGIVYLNNTEYIIVVLTESNSRQLAEERIARISETVYTYFSEKDSK